MLRDRIRTMGFGLPDMGAIRDDLHESFDKLYAVLLEIRDELRLQRQEAPK